MAVVNEVGRGDALTSPGPGVPLSDERNVSHGKRRTEWPQRGPEWSNEAPGKGGSTRKPTAKVARVKVSQAHKDRVAVGVAVAASLSTVALSMVLNVWAFTAVNGGWFGTALGVLLPLWVLALTYQAFHMRKRQPWVSVGLLRAGGLRPRGEPAAPGPRVRQPRTPRVRGLEAGPGNGSCAGSLEVVAGQDA